MQIIQSIQNRIYEIRGERVMPHPWPVAHRLLAPNQAGVSARSNPAAHRLKPIHRHKKCIVVKKAIKNLQENETIVRKAGRYFGYE